VTESGWPDDAGDLAQEDTTQTAGRKRSLNADVVTADLREDLLSSYVTLDNLIGPYLAATRRRLLMESRDRLAARQYYIVVCGEFRRGKSSLLNALVERPGLFPVDVDITTCAVVTLQWDTRDSAMVYFADTDPRNPASAREPETIPVEDAAIFVTEQGNPGNAKNVLRIDMGAPIPKLKSGLVLVDTPGIGSVNPGHTAATRAFLSHADAVLFVASAVEPLTVSELNFLEAALTRCPIVVTVITMIDRLASAAPVVEEARRRIAGITGTAPEELVIVPVSSIRKYDALEEHDPELLAASGFPALEAEIWSGLAITCEAAQIHAALDAMDAGLAEATAPIANDLAALRGDWAKMDAELRAEQEKYRQLKADIYGWRQNLQMDVDRAARPIRQQLDSDLNEIGHQLSQALNADEAIYDPPALVQLMADAMVDAASQARHALETAMERIADKYAELTELSITVSEAASGSGDLGLTVTASRPGKQPVATARFREMWLGGSAGAAAGAVIGTIIPFAGTTAGAVAGFSIGLLGGRRYLKRDAEARRHAYLADLRDNLLPRLEVGRQRLVQNFADLVRNYNQALLRMLEDEATAKGDSLAESIRMLSETNERDAKAREAQGRDLVQRQRMLNGLREELAGLRARTNSLTGNLRVNPEITGPAS
jgi:hypothetical protein